MDMKKISLVLCIMGLIGFATAQSYIVVSGNQLTANTQSNLLIDFALSSHDANLEPGDKGSLTIVIKNAGTQDAKDVELSIKSVDPIRIDKSFFLGDIKYGAPATVSTTYSISEGANVGQYTIPIRLTYDGFKADGTSISNIYTNIDFPIKVYGSPKLVLEDLKIENPVIGAVAVITANLKNEKSDAFNAVVTITPGTPLVTILGSNKNYLGPIKSGQKVGLTFQIYLDDKLQSGAYSLPMNVEYENKGHEKGSETFMIGAFISGEADVGITDVQTDPEEANPGDKDIEVTLKVENTGSSEVDNLKITLNPTTPFKQSKSYIQTKDLGLLKGTESSKISFFIDVEDDAKEGIYDLDLNMEYKIMGVKHEEKKTVSLVIKEKPEFIVFTQPIAVSENEKSSLRMEVTNQGKDCDSVTIWILKKSDHPFDFEDKSQLVGDLEKGQTGEAVIGFTVNEGANDKNFILPLEVRCSKDDKVYISSDKANIQVIKGQEKGENTQLYGMILGGILILAIIIYGLKRISSNNPKKK